MPLAAGSVPTEALPLGHGRFMYVVAGATAATGSASGNRIHILSVSQSTGLVTEIAASPVNLGVSGHRVQGLLVD